MRQLLNVYRRIVSGFFTSQSPTLLTARLFGGFQFAQTGWGKFENLAKITEFFANLNIPVPGFTASAVSLLEFVGGILLLLGLFSRPVAFLLTCNMFVACWIADHDALTSVFSDPGKFYVADPYILLFASSIVLIFCSGLFAVDTLRRVRAVEP